MSYARNSGAPWTPELTQELLDRAKWGSGVLDMAEHFGRAPASIVSKLVNIGYLIPDGGAYYVKPEPYITVKELQNYTKEFAG